MSFSLQTTLFRYIPKIYRRKKGGVLVDAFVEERGQPLSVNLIGIESRRDVARYYANTFERGGRSGVKVSSAKLSKYNKAGENAGVSIRFDSESREWMYLDNKDRNRVAYYLTNHQKSPSHSHVQFVRHLSETDAKKLARAMVRVSFVTVRIYAHF